MTTPDASRSQQSNSDDCPPFDFMEVMMHGNDKLRRINLWAGMISRSLKITLPALRQRYVPQESARIRLFGHDDHPSIIIVQTGRRSGEGAVKIKVGGRSLAARLGAMPGAGKNKSIGMAKSENTRNLKQRHGIFSRACYREFVAPGGRPLQVGNACLGAASSAMAFAGVQFIFEPRGGFSDTVSFIPQAGKDYEVMTYRNGDTCSVMVYEIQPCGDEIRLLPIPVNY